MAESAMTSAAQQTATPRSHEAALLSLVEGMSARARDGASHVVVGTRDAWKWGELERTIGEISCLPPGGDLWRERSSIIGQAAQRLLARLTTEQVRLDSFARFLADMDRWIDGWSDAAHDEALVSKFTSAFLWTTAWHLLAAGASMPSVIKVLAVRPKPLLLSISPLRWHMPTVEIPWSTLSDGWDRARPRAIKALASTREFGQGLIRRALDAYREHRRRERERAEQARQNYEKVLAEERAKADAEAARKREAERLAQARAAETASPPPTFNMALDLNGPAMHRSILPTWLMLVGLSWVSLIWGALISAPFGVGLGIFASLVGGLIAVPLWGTLFGFLGMGAARNSTLRGMGFAKLEPDHPLRSVTETFAAKLSIPTPRVGTIKVHNAFAMGLSHENATIAIGQPLIDNLTPSEVAAVIGHELGHVVSGDMRAMMLMRTFQNATVWYGVTQGVKQIARWVICWAAELAILAFSRQREFFADAIGAALAGKEAMIGALRKLEAAPALTSDETTHARFMVRGKVLSTHPSTADRIQALEDETYIRRLPICP